MALPVFKTEAEVPDSMKPFYAAKEDGTWHVKPEEVPDVTALQTSLNSERTLRETEEKARKDAEKKLVDLRKKQEAKDKGVPEEELERIRKEEEAGRKPLIDENAVLKTENRKLKLSDRVLKLFLEAGGMPERQEDAMMHLERRTDLGDKDGIVVKDKAGNVTAEKIEDFLTKTFKTEKPWLYTGSGAGGGGATGTTASGEPIPAANPEAQAAKQRAVHGAF